MSRRDDAGEAFTEIVLEVFRIHRLLLDHGDRLTGPVGLTSARWQVLGIVEHGPTSVPDVARAMGLTRQSVRETANALAADGFLEFVENPRHRRSRLLAITPKGAAAMEEVARLQAAWADRIGGTRAPEALRQVASELRHLRTALESDAVDGRPGDRAGRERLRGGSDGPP